MTQQNSTDPDARLAFEPRVRRFLEHIIEHEDDMNIWTQLGVPLSSEAEACEFLAKCRKNNPTRHFRLVKRMTFSRVMDA